MQGAGLDPVVEDAGSGQEFGKVDDLAMGRGLRRMIPANMYAPAHRLHCCKFFAGLREGRFYALDDFTRRVSVPKNRQAPSLLGF